MKRTLLKTGAIWGALLLYLVTTQPDTLPLLGLIVPYILLFLALYSTFRLGDALRSRFGRGGELIETKDGPNRLATVLSLAAILLLTLQSIGQLSVRDVVTLGAILIMGYLYFTRNHIGRDQQSTR